MYARFGSDWRNNCTEGGRAALTGVSRPEPLLEGGWITRTSSSASIPDNDEHEDSENVESLATPTPSPASSNLLSRALKPRSPLSRGFTTSDVPAALLGIGFDVDAGAVALLLTDAMRLRSMLVTPATSRAVGSGKARQVKVTRRLGDIMGYVPSTELRGDTGTLPGGD